YPKTLRNYVRLVAYSHAVVVDAIFRSYSDFMTVGAPSSSYVSEENYFFYNLSNLASKTLLSDKYQKQRELLEGLVVRGPGFEVNGVKRTTKKNASGKGQAGYVNGEDQFKKDFKIISLTEDRRVYAGQIIGNEEAIRGMDNLARKLIAYRKAEKQNPYLEGRRNRGFSQGILLLGDTGTGKTLSAYYGMTVLQDKARRYGRDIEFVKFDMESSFQEGGVQMLRHQLEQICIGDKTYFIFIDEIDTVVTSRTDLNSSSHYQNQKLGELIRFLDGDYPNPGNYGLVGTTNKPDLVDRALSNARFERIYCEGPVTAEDDVKNTEKIKIPDWRTVGRYAHQAGLNGRQLKAVVTNCYKLVDNISQEQEDAINSAATVNEARRLISQYNGVITQAMVIDQIRKYQDKDLGEAKTMVKFG
ncbi:AAA family ATPase, partial [Nanoarchaeota archaeon]